MRRPPFSRPVLIAALAALGGCGSWFPGGDPVAHWIPAYRMDIQQGNVVTSEQLAQLKPGMNRLQVRDLLGTPLLTDVFHAGRWDYVFTLAQRGRPVQRRAVKLIFDGEQLQDIQATELPTEQEFVASIARHEGDVSAAQLQLTPEQIAALPVPAAASAPAAAAAPAAASGPPRSYPPLEPS